MSEDGTISKSGVSQWYPAPFAVDGSVYPTAEHWMMAEKVRPFGDYWAAAAILAAITPKLAVRPM